MARFLKSRLLSHGSTPGSIVFIGNKKMEKSEIHLTVFNKDFLSEKQIESLDDIPKDLPENTIIWLNIYGLQDIALIEKVGELFTIPSLELEDIVNTDQRPKFIENENNLTVFLKILEYKNDITRVVGDHLSVVIGTNYVITFQEKIAHYFDPVRARLRNENSRLRQLGPDYLGYALIDTLVDGYIHCIESLGSVIEEMEEEVFTETRNETVQKIYKLKTNVGFIRKNVFPLKEMMIMMIKSDSKLIHKKTVTFLKDLQDLTTQALEAVDIYYNMTTDYQNIYHSNVGNRTNDVMKVLTIFASIFIPLTFIAGVYGTNFDVLPELHYKYSYFIMLGVMIAVAIVMLIYFKIKDWL